MLDCEDDAFHRWRDLMSSKQETDEERKALAFKTNMRITSRWNTPVHPW